MTAKRTAAASKTVASAAQTGDSLATLKALRDALAEAIDDCDSKRDLAALSRQLMTVLALIDAAAPRAVTSKRDEIAAKRARRRAEVANRALVEGAFAQALRADAARPSRHAAEPVTMPATAFMTPDEDAGQVSAALEERDIP
jgi:hypothetical protein